MLVVTVEAQGYNPNEAEDEGLRLLEAFPEELNVTGGVNTEKGLLMVRFALEETDPVVAHTEALEVWGKAWESAFPGLSQTTRLTVTARPPETDGERLLGGVSVTIGDDDGDEVGDEADWDVTGAGAP